MATRGRNICNTLKAIRKQIADANGIDYSPEECHFKGECRGTCPKCEQDASDLEYELRLRAMAGKAIKVAGIAAGLVAMTACSDGKPQRGIPGTNTGEAVLVEEDSADTSNLSGKVDGTKPEIIVEGVEDGGIYNTIILAGENGTGKTYCNYYSCTKGWRTSVQC